MHPIHYFVHVPKTAGITVQAWLREVYEPGEVIFVYEAGTEGVGWTYSHAELLRRAGEISRDVRVFFGHYSFDPAELLHPACRGLGFVREPRARVLSWRRFVVAKGDELPEPDMVAISARLRAGASLPDVAREFDGIRELDNGIVRMFANARGPVGIVGEAELQRAIAVVERHFDFVGHIDRFDASMRRIAAILGKPYATAEHRNVSVGGRSEAAIARGEISAEEAAWIEARTEYDARFVQWVLARFHGAGEAAP